ncbi:MAG: TolC family protein [Proteobacteria bacterium]|jgi:outer membrane protein|nr:TolC family protein [Pseudomonadota bacterium]
MKDSIRWLFCLSFASSISMASIAQDYDSTGITGTTLEDFFSAAIDYSPQLKIAEERLNIGSARTSAAKGQLLPQLRANASRSDNRRNALGAVDTFDGERYSITLTQVLFNWQAFSARNEASLLEDQFEAEYFGELAFLLTDVAEKYFDVLLASDALNSIASELDAVSNQLDQIQSMYDRQLAQITDLYQAQASLAAVEAQQLQLQTELAMRREALRSASGVESGDLYRLSDETNIPPLENSINYWVQQAEENNHQISAREYAVEAADKRIDQRRGAYMPQVNFVVQRQDSDVGFDNRPQDRTDNTYIGLDVTIPLYAGGSNRAGVREATSQRRIAESELRQVQLQANERVRSAYLQVQSAETMIEAARKLLESTELTSTAMQRGFELGAVTNVDVLNALRDQFRAERDLQRTRYDQVKFLLLLKREAGLLSADDMLEVGGWLEPAGN